MLHNIVERLMGSASYRIPMNVSEVYMFRNGSSYSVCPRCKHTMEREYQSYCDRCGQALNWEDFEKSLIILK